MPHLVWVYGGSLTDGLIAGVRVDASSELCKLGWRVTLVLEGPASRQSIRGVEVLCIPKPQVYLLRQVLFHLGVLEFLMREWASLDVLLFHQMTAPWVLPLRVVRWLRGGQGPLLVMDTRDLNRPGGNLKRRLRVLFEKAAHRIANRWTDGQTAITRRMADLVRIPPQQLKGIWPSGVNLERFAPAQTARRWPSTGEPIHLVYIGAMIRDRNLLLLCQAVERANAEGMSFVLSIIGYGPERAALERFAGQTDGQIRIVPQVPRDQVPGCLAQAHIGVTSLFSPDHEIAQASSPIKLFEYLAAGLPILATRNACYTDVVGDGEYAFWAQDAGEEALLKALHLIWQFRDSLDEMGCQAAIAAEAWTWRESAEKLKTALERGLASVR